MTPSPTLHIPAIGGEMCSTSLQFLVAKGDGVTQTLSAQLTWSHITLMKTNTTNKQIRWAETWH
jgi:hypothetical protein